MKKLFLIVAVAASVTLFSACSKTCICALSPAGSSKSNEFEVEITQEMKEAGVSKCSDLNYSEQISSGYSPETMKCR